MKSGATNPKKENAFCREPTLSEPPLACSASQGLADHPIGLSTAPALATFRTLRIHCPLTYYPTHAYIIRDQRSHAHTSENWPIKRLFFPRLTRAHTHAHLVSTVSHRRDARREHEPRKKKEKITTRPPGTRAPPRFSRACVDSDSRPRARRPAFSISSFFTNYSGTGN